MTLKLWHIGTNLCTVISPRKLEPSAMQLLTTDHMLLLQVQIVPAYQAPELLHSLTKVGVKALIFSEFFKSNSCYQIVRTVIPELDSCPESGVRLQNSKVPLLQFLIIMGSKQYR